MATVVVVVAVAGFSIVSSSAARADIEFPYDTSFDDAAGGVLGGTARLESGALRLTDAAPNQAGSWTTSDSFDSTLGLDISFDYAVYRGASSRPAGDGLAFFLADGSAAPGTGAFGAALGYSCKGPGTGTGACVLPGVPGGYVGIGLDEYGAFSTALNGSGPGSQPGSVAVRGSGDGLTGYDYRLGKPVSGGVETGSREAARKVRVLIEPTNGRIRFSVFMNAGGDSPLEPVFDHVDMDGWAGQASLPRTLRLGFSGATGSATNVHEIDSLSVNVPTDLAVDKTGPATVAAGGRISWKIVAHNDGMNSAQGASVTDVPPAAVTDVHWTCSAEPGSTCRDASGTGSVDGALVDLPAKTGKATFTVSGRVDLAATGRLVNEASIQPPSDRSDVDPDNDRSTATTVVTTRAELTTTKSFALVGGSANEVTPGGELTYTVTAHNEGPSLAHEVGATDVLPAGISFVSSSDGCSAERQKVTCSSHETVAVGRSKAFTFRARLDPGYSGDGSDLPNVGIATSVDDPDGATPSDPVTIPVGPAQAQLSTHKEAMLPEAGFVRPGDRWAYEVTALNHGPSTAREVGVIDDLPRGLRFVDGDSGCTARGQMVTCSSKSSLRPGESKVFRIAVELDAGYRGDGGDLGNVAVATSPTDGDGGDESDRVFVPVRVDASTPSPSSRPSSGPVAGSGARPAAPMLAFTGSTMVAGAVSLAVLLAAAGGSFLLIARRRRRGSTTGE